MTREEKQKAIDTLKISAPVRAMTQEEFNDYIQTINQIMDWLEQEPCEKIQMVDKSNFSQEQYRADLQSAYDCGKASVAPCEDAISRQAMLDGLARIAKAKARSDAQKSLMGRVMFFTEHLPSVTPQQKRGTWITSSHGFPPEPTTVCSECGFDRDFYVSSRGFDKIKYCPNCGAKMAESEVKE